MDVKYISPFVESVYHTMQTMLGEAPKRKEVVMKNDNHAHGDISGIVGFASDKIYGSVALTFPTETAVKCYNMMVGDNVDIITDDVRDTVGELTNIIAGGAKKIYADQELSFDISIPTIVLGKNHVLSHKVGTPVVIVPFVIGEHPFVVEISVKFEKNAAFKSKTPKTEAASAQG
ncbi:MAG: chemotaxis protein CheX [candidate division Zixibacteria bacterium]